jgi:predicted DNA-binding transcriptional regulator YafY
MTASILKPEIRKRLMAIELVALWEGRLVTNRLMQWFGISRQQASSDIRRYINEVNPGALVHDLAEKGYVPTVALQPALSSGQVSEYLELLISQNQQPCAEIVDAQDGICAVQLPDRALRPEIVREIVRATQTGNSLKIVYSSMSNPLPHERVITPHTLVYSGYRWHVRAYCHSRKAFRDFLVSRISRPPLPTIAVAPQSAEDEQWQKSVSLILIPNQHLSEAQRALVERDYAMPEGRLIVKTREALAIYVLQRYRAAITDQQCQRAAEHPLQLLKTDRKKLATLHFDEEAV